MDVAAIYANIRKLAHDRGMSNSDLILFINQAVAEIGGRGYLYQDKQIDETVTVPAGASVIVTTYPIKTLLRCSAEVTADSGGIRLLSPVSADTDIQISYISKITTFDGTENTNVLDPWLYIYGATHYACAHRLAPETAYYRSVFDAQIAKAFADSAFLDGGENSLSAEIYGI